MEPIRVVLVEDNDVFRHALELLLTLRGDIEIAGSEPDGSRVVEVCRESGAHVVVLDSRLPGRDGVQLTRQLRRKHPGVAVVALTAAAGEREAEAMLEAGAVACVRKDEPLDRILAAIKHAAGREGVAA